MYYAAQDIIEYLLASTNGGVQDSEHRLLRAAAHNAYRDVVNARDWGWHVSEATLTDDPSVGSGNGTTTFTLPENVKNLDSIVPPLSVAIPTVYLTPTEWTRIQVKFPQINAPIYWTIVKDPVMPDRWLLKLAGQTQPTTYTYTYRRQPAMLRYMGYEPICRQPGFTVNGAVRRYGTATTFPESAYGINPYTAQEIIGLAGSMQGTPPASAKTVVSDYLDVSQPMYTAILSGAEMWMARLMGKNVEGASAIFARDMRLAFEADSVAPISGTRRGWSIIGAARALGYYTPSGPDTGA
jgi:hypothetical protein